MSICHCLTGIATLLIGLQLFSPAIVDANVKLGLSHPIASNSSFLTSDTQDLPNLVLLKPSNPSFHPPNNGGPDYSRASGTR
ncbi:MAG: hypothetical protein AB1589_04410 [Cyanobacteriota bacterium]